jgi:hypothetical protein
MVTVLVGAVVGIAAQALAQFTQQGPKLVGTLPVGSPEQGYSVALSADGDTAIVGGPSVPTLTLVAHERLFRGSRSPMRSR